MVGTGVAARVADWLDTAFRLWTVCGVDPRTGLFHESLDRDGEPGGEARMRVRVQGRQLFCFARAAEAGHDAARNRLGAALDAVATSCQGPDGGWYHLLDIDGAVIDDRHDAYDQAFMLFGLAAAHRAGMEAARPLADRTLRFLDGALAHPGGRGLREVLPDSLPDRLPRRSNPHMHLLEALLAWHGATGEAGFLHRADAVADLFAAHFFRPGPGGADGTLGEFFAEDWQPAAEPAGSSVEPGHHGEWCWLLHRLFEAGGRDLRNEARQLHRWLMAHGLDADGFAVDESGRDGRVRRASRRLWPQCELIKSLRITGDEAAALGVAERVLDTYLATTPPGLWIDRFDDSGRPDGALVPASTLYHLVVAFEDLVRPA